MVGGAPQAGLVDAPEFTVFVRLLRSLTMQGKTPCAGLKACVPENQDMHREARP
jgi:hypothetical protein